MSLTAANSGDAAREYDIRLGIAWGGDDQLRAVICDQNSMPPTGFPGSCPQRDALEVANYGMIRASVLLNGDSIRLLDQTREIALDAVNQMGARYLHCIKDSTPM